MSLREELIAFLLTFTSAPPPPPAHRNTTCDPEAIGRQLSELWILAQCLSLLLSTTNDDFNL